MMVYILICILSKKGTLNQILLYSSQGNLHTQGLSCPDRFSSRGGDRYSFGQNARCYYGCNPQFRIPSPAI